MRLPIDDALPDLIAALRGKGRAVLQAPPGAGKTTKVPLAILEAGLCKGRILMLEPRRLAARAAAERMAQTLGEGVGATVGYRMRGETKTSKATRIEVVTEGILTRMLHSDPELPEIGMVIFDEFHERSLNADLGLALCQEVRETLRDDLQLLVMSATLDAGPVAALLDAPIVTSQGRSFDVETKWLAKPLPKTTRLPQACADLIAQAVSETTGGVLVFLPGEGEIKRTQAALAGRLPPDCEVRPLYGALPFAAQRAAIAPVKEGRKIVLSTSIAETSLTIEDIRVVVDAGLARRAKFDAGSGMSRLVTERASKAEATQRAGRAGRVAEGTCYRLWTKGEDGALPAFAPPEIAIADLASFALDLALWGSAPDGLALITMPNAGAFEEAQALLHQLGALDAQSRITAHGRAMVNLPVHPRLAHMLLIAGAQAAPVAAILSERDPLRGAPVDLSLRLTALSRTTAYDTNRGALDRIKSEARRLSKGLPQTAALSPSQAAALAYPDRIGQRRAGDEARFVLSGGKGAVMPEGDPMASATLIVATDLDGNPREARIRQAIQITEAELRDTFAGDIAWRDVCAWSKRERKVIARRQEGLGAVILRDEVWRDASDEAVARAMLDGVRQLGLTLSKPARLLVARVSLARAGGADLPDMTPEALSEDLTWLMPYLSGIKSAQDWKGFDVTPALKAMLTWEQTQTLDVEAPAQITTPLGRKLAIDYSDGVPQISVRLQEMFGVTKHPTVGGTPVQITLLSPAQRPVQVTTDLPSFWASSYADVRKDMRGRYPRHPWPEDPTQADPTMRAKPRGT